MEGRQGECRHFVHRGRLAAFVIGLRSGPEGLSHEDHTGSYASDEEVYTWELSHMESPSVRATLWADDEQESYYTDAPYIGEG